MKRLAIRALIALTTFTVGILSALLWSIMPFSRQIDKKPPMSPDILAQSALPMKILPRVAPAKDQATGGQSRRVSQEELVNLPGVGRVRISAHEEYGKQLHLDVNDSATNDLLLTVYFASNEYFTPTAGHDDFNAYLRFKLLSIKGLPSPLIVVVATAPGESDSAWEVAAIGAVNGEVKDLTWDHLTAANEGGFFFGNLGHGIGFGTAVWDVIWDEDECHPDPHRYEVKLYKWNKQNSRFDWHRVFRTRGKFLSGQEALRASGFSFRDVRKAFPEFEDFSN